MGPNLQIRQVRLAARGLSDDRLPHGAVQRGGEAIYQGKRGELQPLKRQPRRVRRQGGSAIKRSTVQHHGSS